MAALITLVDGQESKEWHTFKKESGTYNVRMIGLSIKQCPQTAPCGVQ